MAIRFMTCLLFHLGRDFSTDYANRFWLKKDFGTVNPNRKSVQTTQNERAQLFWKSWIRAKCSNSLCFASDFCQNRVLVIFQKSVLSSFYEENHILEFWPGGGGPLFGPQGVGRILPPGVGDHFLVLRVSDGSCSWVGDHFLTLIYANWC